MGFPGRGSLGQRWVVLSSSMLIMVLLKLRLGKRKREEEIEIMDCLEISVSSCLLSFLHRCVAAVSWEYIYLSELVC